MGRAQLPCTCSANLKSCCHSSLTKYSKNTQTFMYNTQQHSSKLSNNAPVITATAVLPSAPLYTPLPQDKASSASGAPLNDKQIQQLKAQGFTHSLAESINDVKKHFPLRIWVVDNSGSMHQDDGHRIVDRVASAGDQSSSVRMVPCTRWAEISS